MKTHLGIEVCMLYWRNYVKSGCVVAGFHCLDQNTNKMKLHITSPKRLTFSLHQKNPSPNRTSPIKSSPIKSSPKNYIFPVAIVRRLFASPNNGQLNFPPVLILFSLFHRSRFYDLRRLRNEISSPQNYSFRFIFF